MEIAETSSGIEDGDEESGTSSTFSVSGLIFCNSHLSHQSSFERDAHVFGTDQHNQALALIAA